MGIDQLRFELITAINTQGYTFKEDMLDVEEFTEDFISDNGYLMTSFLVGEDKGSRRYLKICLRDYGPDYKFYRIEIIISENL